MKVDRVLISAEQISDVMLNSVPEPSTVALLCVTGFGLLLARRRS